MSNTFYVLFFIGFVVLMFVVMYLSFRPQEETSVLIRWSQLVGFCLSGISFIVDGKTPYIYYGWLLVFFGIVLFPCLKDLEERSKKNENNEEK